ncbi:MAG TPA: hypothetical protein PLF40_14255 [Kofleriaceae bacterium]|nr:hypothetical protein [Kofleriaceae bacterium]
MFAIRLVAVVGLVGVTACKSNEKKTPVAPETGSAEGPSRLVGVYPKLFKCDSLLSNAELTNLVGGGTVHVVDGTLRPPNGLAAPCTYLIDKLPEAAGAGSGSGSGSAPPPQPAAWTFDIDCRDDAKTTADKLFAMYRNISADSTAQYNAALDAGQIVPNDAGVAPRAPEGTLDVAVGARAIDHNGQGLIFWDDDAPCYVRIVGPDPSGRLALGKHLADRLTPKTAPMTPRLPENL